jgi:hypothetical protein
MQKQIILRIFILMALSAILLFSGSLSPSEITNMVSEIKKERKGISLLTLETTANPFIIRIPKKKESTEVKESVDVMVIEKVVYTLKAILNKAAFIDKKWYKQGDSIGDYKVGYVSLTSVVLKGLSGNRTLSLEKKKKNFIKLNRGNK